MSAQEGMQAGDVKCGDWIRRLDVATSQYYYANIATQESTWEKPEEFVDPDEAKKEEDEPLVGGASSAGAADANDGVQAMAAAAEWVKVFDENTQKDYWFNKTTFQTQWDEPAEIGTGRTRAETVLASAGDGVAETEKAMAAATVSQPTMRESMKVVMQGQGLIDDDDDGEDAGGGEDDDDEDEIMSPTSAAATANATDSLFEDNDEDSQSHEVVKDPAYLAAKEHGDSDLSERQVTENADRLSESVEEFLEDEKGYLKRIQCVARDFIEALGKAKERGKSQGNAVITRGELNVIIRNLPEVYDCHANMWIALKKLGNLEKPEKGAQLANLFKTFIGPLQCYGFYKSDQEAAQKMYDAIFKERKRDHKLLKQAFEEAHLIAKVDVMEILKEAHNRLDFYISQFLSFVKLTDPKGAQYGTFFESLKSLVSLKLELEESIRMKHARDKVTHISRTLYFENHEKPPFRLVTPNRYYVKDGHLRKRFNGGAVGSKYKNYMFFLFNDILMYTTLPDKKGRITPKYLLPLMDAEITEVNNKKETNFMVQCKAVKSVTLKAKDTMERASWMLAIKNVVTTLKEDAINQKLHEKRMEGTGKRGW